MPQPIWMSVILLVYASLTILIAFLAIVVRVFKLRPKSTRMVANAQVLINLKKIFGWASIGLFLFQFIYEAALSGIEPKVSQDIFDFMAWIFFLILASAFYMLALWFLSSSLARTSKSEVLTTHAEPNPEPPKVNILIGQQTYTTEEVEKETRYIRRLIYWITPIMVIFGLGITIPMSKYGFHMSWSGVFAFNFFFYFVGIAMWLISLKWYVKQMVKMRLEIKRRSKPESQLP